MSDEGLPERHVACHEAYIEAWNAHDPAGVRAEFADGGTYVDPLFDEPISGAEIGDFVRMTAGRFPDFRFEQRRLIDAPPADVRIEEWTMHGTHTGMRDGLPPTGNTIALDGVSVVQFEDGGIASIQGYYDQQELAAQLGLTFPTVLRQLPSMAVRTIGEVV